MKNVQYSHVVSVFTKTDGGGCLTAESKGNKVTFLTTLWVVYDQEATAAQLCLHLTAFRKQKHFKMVSGTTQPC